MELCENCSNEIINRYVHNEDKPELKDKKFCSHACMEQYYNKTKSKKNEQVVSDFWKNYKGWIIGGGIGLVIIIVLGIVFSRKRS